MPAALIVISFLITCDDNDTQTYNISGKVQKGTLQIGSNITLIELDNSLNPTGRTFFSTIIDNEGKFEFPEVEFSSDYIEIKAEGSYYDEAVDAFSYQNITLFTLSRLKDHETINVNILTHIQRERIKRLIDDGLSFELAFKQSQKELLTIFGFENYVLDDFLNLDLNDDSSGSSILLVISMIIATHNNVLQEFITQLSTDFKDDGKIDSEDLQHRLVNTAKF